MTKKARAWTGATLLVVLMFNYAVMALPLVKRSALLKEKANSIFIRQIKAGDVLSGSVDDYVLELLRIEKTSLDKKLKMLNVVSVTMAILIASWTIFGLILPKKKGSL